MTQRQSGVSGLRLRLLPSLWLLSSLGRRAGNGTRGGGASAPVGGPSPPPSTDKVTGWLSNMIKLLPTKVTLARQAPRSSLQASNKAGVPAQPRDLLGR